MYVKVTELPSSLQSALSSLGYGRVDVSVNAAETVTPMDAGQAGHRGFFCAVNLANGERTIKRGSWGGANIFVRNQVDSDDASYPIPLNGAAIKGSESGGPVWATIYVNPANLAKLLPTKPAVELSQTARKVLKVIKECNSMGRKWEWDNMRLDPKPFYDELAALGLVKITKAGAVSITTEGRNVAAETRGA